MMEYAIHLRQGSLSGEIRWIPIVDAGSPRHADEAKPGVLNLRAKNFSRMKSNSMAETRQMKAYR
jgi:hypothetical protein